MGLMDSSFLNIMSTELDGLWARQEVISDNIANYETPNYKRKTVSFEDELKDAILSSDSSSDADDKLSNVQFSVSEDTDTTRLDGNSVDLEQESIDMARTLYQYMYSQRVVSDYFTRLSTAINGGE